MLVQCPKCKTTYKVSDEVVRGAAPSFRCSRCKHTFELEPAPESTADISDGGANETGEIGELAFSFEPAARAKPESSRADSPPPAEPKEQPQPTSHTETEGNIKKPAGNRENERPVVIPASGTNEKGKAPETLTVEEPPYHIDPQSRETSDKVLAIEPYRDQPASLTPFLILFGLLVIFSAFVLAYQQTYPAALEGWVQSIPLLGPSVVRNDYLKNGVLLKSVETRYQSLQGNRDVVVLTGFAVNQNPAMIRNVQLLGLLYDPEGKEVERQTMWIGNAISAQIIRGMTAQDVTDLQRLKPLKTFEIPPGDSVPFAIVFLRAGKQVYNARCEVLSAQGDA